MRRILLVLISILGTSVFAQAQVGRTVTLVSANHVGTAINEIGSGVNLHVFTWNVTGTLSACSVKLEKSANGTSGWTDLIAGQACTTSGGPTTITGPTVANYVRVNATTFTGTGTLTVRYDGLTAVSSSTVTVVGDVATTVADCADVVLGCKADAKSTASDTTAITIMQALKEVSFQVQAIAALAATDPCSGAKKTVVPFSITSATTTQLLATSASNKWYICGLNIVTAIANNIALVEDDTAACASPTAGMAGGTTAANGWNFAATSGMTLGNGSGTVAVTAATDRYVCLITSANGPTAGTITAVPFP